jgi:L,D-transpeptidase catalytic domain
MRGLTPTASALLGAFALVPTAAAEVFISVDKTTQRMTVSVDGQERYSWPVSTGMAGYVTPSGAFTPSHLKKQHYSREWDNAPMPHSIFFTGDGHAIHGSHVTGRLGTPASHGCVRLAPAHASTLFELVRAEGLGSTRIEVTGTDPVGGIRIAGRSGGWRDYRGIVAFDPLSTGIMSGGSGTRLRSEPSGRP